MTIVPLRITCPKCQSTDIAYSCEPDCCFNHVCGNCLGNFQLSTTDLGERVAAEALREGYDESDSCDPTARCAKCGSLRVKSIEAGEAGAARAVCLDCRSMLALVLE
jgi:hypothetical protein